MGLTLNTNSLTVASSGGSSSAASGVSTSDVTTLIKNNTPYQYIAKVDASGGNTISATNVFSATDGYSSYRILFDALVTDNNNNSSLEMRFAVGGTVNSSTVYGWSVVRHNGSSGGQYNYERIDSKWKLVPQDVRTGYTGFIDFSNTASGLRAQAMWHHSGGGSTRDGSFTVGGGGTENTDEISGFEIYSNTAFSGGFVRIYGVNNV